MYDLNKKKSRRIEHAAIQNEKLMNWNKEIYEVKIYIYKSYEKLYQLMIKNEIQCLTKKWCDMIFI